MGLFDKLRAELVDIVEWVDDSRHTLVWRFPRYHNQIKHGAQLIVRPGQMAVFVHEGKIADVFGPGRTGSRRANLPVLSTLQGWKYGFDSPFKAEVYFVATRQVTDLKWGTPNPVLVRDPDFGPIRVRAFGTYTLQGRRPEARCSRSSSAPTRIFEAEEIAVLLRSIIAHAFADLVAQRRHRRRSTSPSQLRRARRSSCAQLVVERIDDEYGLDDPAALHRQHLGARGSREGARRALVDGVVGDLAAYQPYQLGAATPVAAANPAGGLAGAGVGVGMGLAMANRIGPAQRRR